MTHSLYLSCHLPLFLGYNWNKKLMYKHRNNKGSLTALSDQLCATSERVMFTADTVAYKFITSTLLLVWARCNLPCEENAKLACRGEKSSLQERKLTVVVGKQIHTRRITTGGPTGLKHTFNSRPLIRPVSLVAFCMCFYWSDLFCPKLQFQPRIELGTFYRCCIIPVSGPSGHRSDPESLSHLHCSVPGWSPVQIKHFHINLFIMTTQTQKHYTVKYSQACSPC